MLGWSDKRKRERANKLELESTSQNLKAEQPQVRTSSFFRFTSLEEWNRQDCPTRRNVHDQAQASRPGRALKWMRKYLCLLSDWLWKTSERLKINTWMLELLKLEKKVILMLDDSKQIQSEFSSKQINILIDIDHHFWQNTKKKSDLIIYFQLIRPVGRSRVLLFVGSRRRSQRGEEEEDLHTWQSRKSNLKCLRRSFGHRRTRKLE